MISSHFLNRRLVNLLLPFICPRYWWWLTDRKHCCNSQIKKPVSFSWIKHESAAHTCHRWQSVAWKPIMRFDISTLDDVKADTNQTPTKLNRFRANRKSRCPCDPRGKHARFARNEIIKLFPLRCHVVRAIWLIASFISYVYFNLLGTAFIINVQFHNNFIISIVNCSMWIK